MYSVQLCFLLIQVGYSYFRNIEQTESSLDALERLMAVPSHTSLEEEEEKREDSDSNVERVARVGGTPKLNSHEAVLPFR